jgi:Putative prokaryotic signal transducing protein
VTSVFRCSDYFEAQLLAGLLRQHGIGVFLQGALSHGGIGELPAMGHLSILVDDPDRTAAERIVKAYERGELAIDEDDVE